MRKRKVKRYSRNEFRYNYKTKHPNYIFEEDGRNYHAIGITHKKRTRDKNKKWRKNIPLCKNPQKNKTDKSYLRYGIITQNKRTFSNVDNRFLFSSDDKPKARAKIHIYKKQKKKK